MKRARPNLGLYNNKEAKICQIFEFMNLTNLKFKTLIGAKMSLKRL